MTDPWDERYIHLHEWWICMVNVGKYINIPYMDPMGLSHSYWFIREKSLLIFMINIENHMVSSKKSVTTAVFMGHSDMPCLFYNLLCISILVDDHYSAIEVPGWAQDPQNWQNKMKQSWWRLYPPVYWRHVIAYHCKAMDATVQHLPLMDFSISAPWRHRGHFALYHKRGKDHGSKQSNDLWRQQTQYAPIKQHITQWQWFNNISYLHNGAFL